jgi:acetyltransferase-like isoleucine patch superfamily enzyme
MSKLTDKLKRVCFRLVPLDWLAESQGELVQREIKRATVQFAHWSSDSILSFPWNALVGLEHISVGKHFHANRGLFLGAYGPASAAPQILIGDNVLINYDCQITAVQQVVLGDGVLLGSRVLITDHGHGDVSLETLSMEPLLRPLVSKGPVHLGKNVWVGSGAVILPGVSLGDGCVVGANAVVTKSFSAYSVIGGNPAQLLSRAADNS